MSDGKKLARVLDILEEEEEQKRKRQKQKKKQKKRARCPDCGFKIRGKNHNQGAHHKRKVVTKK